MTPFQIANKLNTYAQHYFTCPWHTGPYFTLGGPCTCGLGDLRKDLVAASFRKDAR